MARRAGSTAASASTSGRRRADADAARRAFADSARFYLQQTPRQLPSRFLYDDLGSALFDAICHLPWYRITRAERALLTRHAVAIGRAFGDGGRVVELGCGNGEKLAALLAHAGVRRTQAHLIDLSASALDHAARALARLDATGLTITAHHATYEDGLLALPAGGGRRTLLAFLGSNIGNFDPPAAAALLQQMRAALRGGDALLLGADLVKPERDLLLAYDDPLGLTAAFNRNLLVRLNAELGATFALEAFAHRAVWNREASRVEMHLVSRTAQQVVIPAAGLRLTLDAGEAIWTESSYKYEADDLGRLGRNADFTPRQQWIDADAGFALTLFEAV